MARRKRPGELPADVRQVRARIEHWRKTRKKRTAMPAQLWETAASLARTHGVYWTSRALRLNYDSLRRRASAAPGKGRGGMGDHPGFVELSPAQLMGPMQPAGPVVELTDADGAKLTVRLPGNSELDMEDLAEAFWSRRS